MSALSRRRSTRRSRRSIRRSSPESAWRPPSPGLLGFLGLGQSQQSLSIIGTAPPNDSVQVYLEREVAGHGQRQRPGQLELQLRPLVVDGPQRDLQPSPRSRATRRATSARRRRRSSSRSAAARRRIRPGTLRGPCSGRRQRAAWSRSSTATSSSASWRPTRPATGSSRPRCRRANTASWRRRPVARATRACLSGVLNVSTSETLGKAHDLYQPELHMLLTRITCGCLGDRPRSARARGAGPRHRPTVRSSHSRSAGCRAAMPLGDRAQRDHRPGLGPWHAEPAGGGIGLDRQRARRGRGRHLVPLPPGRCRPGRPGTRQTRGGPAVRERAQPVQQRSRRTTATPTTWTAIACWPRSRQTRRTAPPNYAQNLGPGDYFVAVSGAGTSTSRL